MDKEEKWEKAYKKILMCKFCRASILIDSIGSPTKDGDLMLLERTCVCGTRNEDIIVTKEDFADAHNHLANRWARR